MRTFEPVIDHEAIDAQWMTEALSRAAVLDGEQITDLRHEPCGLGLLSDSYRFHLEYDAPTGAPATVVGKFAAADPTSRGFGRDAGYYRTETRFYDELAGGLTVAVPRPLHVALDAGDEAFVLLMEDLAPARAVDQIEGCTYDEAAAVVEQAARLHATRTSSSA